MMTYLMLLAVAAQLPITIPSHEHVTGPTPIQTTKGSGVTCPGSGSLRVETAWSPSTGVTLQSMTLNGRTLRASSTKAITDALKHLWIATEVSVGCFNGDTFNLYITGSQRPPSTTNGHVGALVKKGQVEILP